MVRARGGRCGDRLDRSTGRGNRRYGEQDRGANPRGREWSAGRSRNHRATREREGSREDREEVRLSGSAQGGRGWWRQGDARRLGAEGVISSARRGAQGGKGRVR